MPSISTFSVMAELLGGGRWRPVLAPDVIS